jgi:hypothetical protein
MTQSASLPTTFAGFPAYDDAAALDVRFAVIGVPYLSPYPVEKTYDSQNAVSTIRQASLTYRKIDHYDFDFGGSLLGESSIHCVDCGDIVRGAESFDAYSQTITKTVRRLLEQGAVPIVIGGDHGTTIPVLRAYEDFEDLCVVQIDAHLDWVDERDGIKDGFSSPMRRASEMSWVSSVVQIGLRGQGSARQKEVDIEFYGGCGPQRSIFSKTIRPACMTSRTRDRAAMSAVGSPSTTSRSACLPGWIEPIRSSTPSARAAVLVAAAMAWMAVIPPAVMAASSCHRQPKPV